MNNRFEVLGLNEYAIKDMTLYKSRVLMISLKTLKRNNTCIQQVDENVIFLIFFTCLTEFGSGQSFDIYSSSNFPTCCKIIMSDYKS